MPQPAVFAYLDHNVLDLMTKGDPDGVSNLLQRTQLIPVFSDENFSEIRRSIGYEDKFLDVLEQIGARHLLPVLDESFRHKGGAEIRQIGPRDAYRAYANNVSHLPDTGFGLAGILQKFYGGRQDQSFGKILSNGTDELRQLLKKALEDLENVSGFDDATRAAIAQAVSSLPDLMERQYSNLFKQLDAQPGSVVKQFDEATGLDPKVLNNIQPPGVVHKVWDLVKAHFQGVQLDLETFFGIKPQPFEADANRERTILERVNAIYHQLNFLGYYRDSRMSRQRRFVASFSDLTHAGMASFCSVLLCRDERLVMKAAAAYEYLDVRTVILHYGAKK